jgi:hypothetical protein
MQRVRLYAMGLIVVAIVVLAIYGYVTGQLPGQRSRPLDGVLGPASTPTLTRQMIGKSFVFGDVTYTVSGVERLQEFRRGATVARPLGTFVVVTLAARNTGHEPVLLGRDAFVLVDRQGRRYLPRADVMEALQRNNDEGAWTDVLSPGLAEQGVLVFDVPADATGLSLRILKGYEEVGLE